jgi:Bacterial Ig-like domain
VAGAEGALALTGGVGLVFTEPVTGASAATLGLVGEDGAKVRGTVRAVDGTTYAFVPAAPLVANTAYKPWVSAQVVDLSGKPAVASTTAVRSVKVVDSSSPALVKVRGGWQTVTASDATGSSFVRTSVKPKAKAKASVRAVVRGKSVAVWGCRSSRSGIVTVTVDGKRRATVDLYQRYSSCRKVATVNVAAGRAHTIVVTATGRKNVRSRGTDFAVDAISVS